MGGRDVLVVIAGAVVTTAGAAGVVTAVTIAGVVTATVTTVGAGLVGGTGSS